MLGCETTRRRKGVALLRAHRQAKQPSVRWMDQPAGFRILRTDEELSEALTRAARQEREVRRRLWPRFWHYEAQSGQP